MYATGLVCRQCGAKSEIAPRYYCDSCFGPLEVTYDYDAIREHTTTAHVAAGPSTIWRYRSLLPVSRRPVDLGTGWTPLLRADRLAAALDLK